MATLLAFLVLWLAPARPESALAVFAGGCFWGVEHVFEHVKGVLEVTSGYAGGSSETANYEAVSSGTTGHAESVKITFDPSLVTYETLLKVFFSVAHDPTERDRQGPDIGPQYRSAVFYFNEDQRRIAGATINRLTESKAYPRPIVTEVVALEAFYPAEGYHQNYVVYHPHEPYVVFNDLPKLELFRATFPELAR